MRILYVDNETVWRGGQEQLLGLMVGVHQLGHEVWLASPRGSPLQQRSSREGLRLVSLAQGSELSLFAAVRFYHFLKGRSFDLVHFNTPRSILAGSVASRLAGVRKIVASRRVNFPLRSRLSTLKYNLLLDRVFTVSSSIRTTLIQGGVRAELVEVIYEGVDLSWIDSHHSNHRSRLPEGRPIIGVAAHLSPEKGHSALLEAARILKDRGSVFFICIVGEGDLRSQLEGMAADLGLVDDVLFMGFREDIDTLMNHFDIFCLPSLSEGLSSAILSAMANRLPVVSTTVGGIPELVVDQVTGFLVPPNSPTQLAEALLKLLADVTLRKRLGAAGRRRIEERFTLSKKLSGMERAYCRLLAAC